MSYIPLDSADLEVGKPIKKKLFTRILNNEEDHESRLDNLEQGVGKIIVADFEVTGYISHYKDTELVAIATHKAPARYNLVEFSVTIMDSPNGFNSVGVPVVSSTSGVLELDLRKSVDGGVNYYSICTIKPAILDGYAGAGLSSNSAVGGRACVFSELTVNQDDMLRLDVKGMKDKQGTFSISIYGTLD